VWAGAPRKIQREMLKVIFEAVYVDVLGERLVCVKPYPQFVPLFRMDGMEEREDGCFYYRDKEAGPED
jgi:hypothetical protein